VKVEALDKSSNLRWVARAVMTDDVSMRVLPAECPQHQTPLAFTAFTNTRAVCNPLIFVQHAHCNMHIDITSDLWSSISNTEEEKEDQ